MCCAVLSCSLPLVVARRQTLYKISPNLANNVAFGKLTWFQNAPKIGTNSQVFAATSATALSVQPCLIRFGPAGAPFKIHANLLQSCTSAQIHLMSVCVKCFKVVSGAAQVSRSTPSQSTSRHV